MSTLQFLKPYSELNIDAASMPVKEKDKKELAIWFCRNNGPIPGECLQVGLMILRTLNLHNYSRCPESMVFEAVLEWIKACSPEQIMVGIIVKDLQVCYPMTPDALERVLKGIYEEKPELVLASARIPTRKRMLTAEPIVVA